MLDKSGVSFKGSSRFIFIILAIVSLFFFNPGKRALAQGWTFTFQWSTSGPCGDVPPISLPSYPNLGIPTKATCDYYRQLINSIKSSTPIYKNGKYIGTCTLGYNCSECTGSDINTGGQVTPGQVSVNGLAEGQPYFTTHQSKAFEDWATEYKQLLESYGITSILGKDVNIYKIPATGNKKQDKDYKAKADNFDPDIDNSVVFTPDVVDLAGKKGIVEPFTSPGKQAARDAWYRENGFMDMHNLPGDNYIDESGEEQAGRSITEASIRTALGEVPGSEGAIGVGNVNFIDEAMKQIANVTNEFINGDQNAAAAKAEKMPDDIRVNTFKKTSSDALSDIIIEKTFGPVLKSLPGAEALHKYLKLGYDFWENLQGK